MPINVNGQPIQDNNIQEAQEALEIIENNHQFDSTIFQDRNIDIREATFIMDRNSDGIINRSDLDNLWSYHVRLNERQFCALARLFAERFPREENQEGFAVLSQDVTDPMEHRQLMLDFLAVPRSHINAIPEYSHRNFFFTVMPVDVLDQDARESRQRQRGIEINEQASIANEILQASSQTRCTIFVDSETGLQDVREEYFRAVPALREQHETGRLIFQVGQNNNSIWAQDIGESTQSEFIIGGGTSPYRRDQMDIPWVQIPIRFDGGDITTTTINGENIVIVGHGSIQMTHANYDNFVTTISDDEIRAVLQHAFSVDRVILLTNPTGNNAPELAFHIDQVVTFPSPGVAIMLMPETVTPTTSLPEAEITEDAYSELRGAISHYQDQLRQAGFRIIEIPTTSAHVGNFQSYTNAIPITKDDGSTVIIMPSFDDNSTEEQIRSILEREGMEVRFVRNMTWERRGNTHCITGTLPNE